MNRMNRLKGIALAMALAVLCTVSALPAGAASWSETYWMGRAAESLLSSEFLGTLRLSTRQMEAMHEFRQEQPDQRRLDRLGDLQQVVNLLASGRSVNLDGRRSLDGNIDTLLRGDDEFLRHYYDILNPDQRRVVRNRLARGDANWEGVGWKFGKVRWEMSRELQRELNLTKAEKKQVDRILREASADQRAREKRLRTLERQYYLNNWDNFSGRNDTSFRRQLLETRRNSWLITSNTRDRIRSVLDSRQRASFDSSHAGVFEPYKSSQKQSSPNLKKSDQKLNKPNPGSQPASQDLGQPNPGKGKKKDDKKNN